MDTKLQLEETMDAKIHHVFWDEFAKYIINKMKRYLDDCFIFLNRSCDDLFKIYKLLNDLHKNIQFTMRKRAPFYRSINTNISSYLISNYFWRKQSPVPHFNSCYPAHTKPNMSFDMASRICTLVSVEDLWIKKMKEP